MTAAFSPLANGPALYPPTVIGPERPLPPHRFLFHYARNPLSALPQAVYEERIVAFDNGRSSSPGSLTPAS